MEKYSEGEESEWQKISHKAPLTISEKEIPLYPLFQNPAPYLTSTPVRPPVAFKSPPTLPCGTSGERALEKFVSVKAQVAV